MTITYIEEQKAVGYRLNKEVYPFLLLGFLRLFMTHTRIGPVSISASNLVLGTYNY